MVQKKKINSTESGAASQTWHQFSEINSLIPAHFQIFCKTDSRHQGRRFMFSLGGIEGWNAKMRIQTEVLKFIDKACNGNITHIILLYWPTHYMTLHIQCTCTRF